MKAMRVFVLACLAAGACKSTRTSARGPAQSRDTVPVEAMGEGDAATGDEVAGAQEVRVSGRVHVTEAAPAVCGPDWIRRQPTALADLDRDGALERASVVREGRGLVVRLYRLPAYAKVGEWRIPGDSVEVGATRCKGRTSGDLWLHVGVAQDERGESWTHSLYHLEGGRLRVAAEGIIQTSLFLDVDGDGCVDPFVTDAGGGQVLREGSWTRLPEGFEPMRLFGMPFGFGQSEAVDLDGDGDPDLGMVDEAGLHVVDAESLETVWSRPGQAWNAHVVSWGGRTALVANQDGTLAIFAADGEHTVLASVPGESYLSPIPELDPAGDGSVLALHALGTLLFGPDPAAPPVELGVKTLAGALDDRWPRSGPVRLDMDETPELLGVRILEPGHPMLAFPGSVAKYELLLLAPPGTGEGRVIRQAEVNGALDVEASVVDLEGDGRFEVVVREAAGWSSCDRESNGSASTLYLLDGEGGVLWQDADRTEYFEGGRTPDVAARARAMDLWGDQRTAVRVRAGGQEWYLLPASAASSEPIPVCLE